MSIYRRRMKLMIRDVDAAEQLGFDEYPEPYAQASGESILRGVNYASAAAGIRQETGQQLVNPSFFFLIFFILMSYYNFYLLEN